MPSFVELLLESPKGRLLIADCRALQAVARCLFLASTPGYRLLQQLDSSICTPYATDCQTLLSMCVMTDDISYQMSTDELEIGAIQCLVLDSILSA